MFRSRIFLGAALLAAGLFTVGSHAATVVLEPSADNSMYQDFPNNSSGSGEHLFAGATSASSPRRALLEFDIAGNLPAGATVTSVSLTLACTNSPIGVTQNDPFTLNAVTADWGEAGSDAGLPGGVGAAAATGDATWNNRFHAQLAPWASAGGDFSGSTSGSTSIGQCDMFNPVPMTFASTASMVSDVQGWLDNAASNFGWILRGNEGATVTARRFGSRENGTAGYRPMLTVEFDGGQTAPVPALSTWSTIVFVLLAVGFVYYVSRRDAAAESV